MKKYWPTLFQHFIYAAKWQHIRKGDYKCIIDETWTNYLCFIEYTLGCDGFKILNYINITVRYVYKVQVHVMPSFRLKHVNATHQIR